MSENSAQDKSEKPSQQKLNNARKEGQIARSKELSTAAMFLMGGVCTLWLAPRFGDFFSSLMTNQFQLSRDATRVPEMMPEMAGQALLDMLMAMMPLFLVLAILLVLVGMVPGGFLFVLKNVMPKGEKLNPLKGLKRMVSKETLVELVKSMLKILLIGSTLAIMLYQNWSTLLMMSQMPMLRAMEAGLKMLSMAFIIMGVVLFLVAAIDVPYQRWSLLNKLKMTKQEVKEEHKNSEGSPEVKKRIRSIQQQLSQASIDRRVPDADVVIVNPTHYAVAIKYDINRAEAPFVVAKGVDNMARRIREVAGRSDLEIVSVPELTRAIYYSTRVDQEVPGDLYTAVAYVLTHVMQLKAYKQGRGAKPVPLPSLSIPASLRR